MIVEYELAPSDFVAFTVHHHRHSPASLRQYYRAVFVPPAIWLTVWLILWYTSIDAEHSSWDSFRALLPLLWFLPLYPLVYRWLYHRNMVKIANRMCREGNNRGLFSLQKAEISAEGVANSSAFDQTMTTWAAVERVSRDCEHIYIYVNALMAVIIPRRAFATELEFDGFVESARRFHERAALSRVR